MIFPIFIQLRSRVSRLAAALKLACSSAIIREDDERGKGVTNDIVVGTFCVLHLNISFVLYPFTNSS